MTETHSYRLTAGTKVRMVSRTRSWERDTTEPYIGLEGVVVYVPATQWGYISVKFSGKRLGLDHDVVYTVPAKTLRAC